MAIKKLGNKKYFIRVTKYINKKKRERKFTGIFPTIGAARNKENELIKELNDLKLEEENEELRYTWKKAVDDYLEFSEDNHRLSTFYNRMKVLEAHTRNWNDIEIVDFSKNKIKSHIEDVKCSISHKKELLKYIRQVFEVAIDNRKIQFNPTKNIRLIGDKKFREKANKLSAMTKNEVDLLLNHLKEASHEWYSIFYVTYQLGLRSSEAIALEFEDIEWEKGHIVISKSWCKYKKGFVPPKNGTSRIVPMNRQLRTYLKKRSIEMGRTGFVLPRITSWLNGGATKVLQAIQDTLGIRRTNYHSLRASFITHLLRSGVDVITVQAMVGHRELSTTQRYIRLDATDLKGATDALERNEDKFGRLINLKKN